MSNGTFLTVFSAFNDIDFLCCLNRCLPPVLLPAVYAEICNFFLRPAVVQFSDKFLLIVVQRTSFFQAVADKAEIVCVDGALKTV